MKLYAGTTEQFVRDAMQHRIAEKLAVEYKAAIGHKPGAAEYTSWQNSLTALGWLVDHAKLNDHGIILEYRPARDSAGRNGPTSITGGGASPPAGTSLRPQGAC